MGCGLELGCSLCCLRCTLTLTLGLTFMIYTRATKTPSGLVLFSAEASKIPRGLLYSRPPSFPPTLIVTSFVLINRLIESLTTGSALARGQAARSPVIVVGNRGELRGVLFRLTLTFAPFSAARGRGVREFGQLAPLCSGSAVDFVKRFRGKGVGRLGLVLATVVPLHRPPIGQGRHRNGC